tara:strand:- start:1229 stop:1426 length:198 start_codon:yes stop_codon:yes gene_type:complete
MTRVPDITVKIESSGGKCKGEIQKQLFIAPTIAQSDYKLKGPTQQAIDHGECRGYREKYYLGDPC